MRGREDLDERDLINALDTCDGNVAPFGWQAGVFSVAEKCTCADGDACTRGTTAGVWKEGRRDVVVPLCLPCWESLGGA